MAESYNKFIEDKYTDSAIKKRAEALTTQEKARQTRQTPSIPSEKGQVIYTQTIAQTQELKYQINANNIINDIINNPEKTKEDVLKTFEKIEKLTKKQIENIINLRDDIYLLSKKDIDIATLKIMYSKEI